MPTPYRAIYRRTRGNDPGVYYRKLTPTQQKNLTQKWKKLRHAGKIHVHKDWLLLLMEENPEWEIWKKISRTRFPETRGASFEEAEYTLCFGKPFKAVKHKPKALKYG
jgi:hypothetical protein